MSFQEISLDQFKVFELEENAKCIVDDVQNVYAAQVFDAFAVKVSFISQEISKIEHTQSQHQAKVDNQESWRPFSLAPTKLVSACYEESTIGASPSVWTLRALSIDPSIHPSPVWETITRAHVNSCIIGARVFK